MKEGTNPEEYLTDTVSDWMKTKRAPIGKKAFRVKWPGMNPDMTIPTEKRGKS